MKNLPVLPFESHLVKAYTMLLLASSSGLHGKDRWLYTNNSMGK